MNEGGEIMSVPTFQSVKTYEWITGHCALGSKSVLSPSWWHASNVLIPENKLFYITDGELIIEIDGKAYVGRRGDMMFIPAGVRHNYRLTDLGYAEKYWCHFTLESGGVSLFAPYVLPYLVTIGVSPEAETLFSELVSHLTDGDRLDEVVVLGSLYRLLSIYLDASGAVPRERAGDEIDGLIRMIRHDPSADYTLESLARATHFSPNYLIRKFHARVGMPPMKYLNRVRMETAKSLLAGTDLPLSAVMSRVGATDAANFSRSFKLAFGYPPNTYRKLKRQ